MKRKATKELSDQLAKEEKIYPEPIHKRRLLIKQLLLGEIFMVKYDITQECS
jgi:hypothetical protein